MKPRKSSDKRKAMKNLNKLQGNKKQAAPLKQRPKSKKITKREMNVILNKDDTSRIKSNINKEVFNKNVNFDKLRKKSHEKVIAESINNYRGFNKIGKLKSSQLCKEEMSQICLYNVERGKFEFDMFKALMPKFKKNGMICYVSIYVDKDNKNYGSPEKLEKYTMNKWKSQSTMDSNLKSGAASQMNIVVMESVKGICVFVVLFK